jgi:hypothetical protein
MRHPASRTKYADIRRCTSWIRAIRELGTISGTSTSVANPPPSRPNSPMVIMLFALACAVALLTF